MVCEGADMPASPEAVRIFLDKKLLYAPGKAANAGGGCGGIRFEDGSKQNAFKLVGRRSRSASANHCEKLLNDENRLSIAAFQEDGVLLSLSAFEPTTWTVVRFRLWRDSQLLSRLAETQTYNGLHVSNPARK
jgi:hypothetical protein